MRPLLLELTAFGPFATTERIDFRPALDARLFGIYGPTGAGKTSLLDALCFALFGESSGDERKGDDLRAHRADPAVYTQVRLVFELGARRYHVVRTPRQRVAALRGGGLTERGPTAALFDASDLPLDTIGEASPGTVLVERKVQAVNDRLQRLLGYDAAQFRHVVMLPQGRFRQLLTARSDERSSVLRGLFDVALYERLTQQLRDAAADTHTAVEAARAQVSALLGQAGLASAEAIADTRAQARQARTDAVAAQERALAGQAATAAAVRAGEALRQLLEERNAVLARQQALDAAAPAIAALRERRAVALKALQVRPAQQALSETEALLGRTRSSLADAEAARQVAQDDLLRCQQARDEAAARAGWIEDTRLQIARLRQCEQQLAALAPLQSRLEALERQCAADRVALDGCTAAAAEAQQRARTTAQALNEAHAGARERAELERMLETLRTAEATAARRNQHLARCTALTRQLAAQEVVVSDAGAALAATRARREAAAAAAARHHAGQLARTLAAGTPCPVCGARDHPDPARTAEGPGGEAVEEADAALDTAFHALQEATQQRADLRARLAAEQDALAALQPAAEAGSGLGERIAAAEQRHAALGRNPDVATATKSAEQAAARAEAAVAAREAALAALQAGEQDRAAAAAQVAQTRSLLPVAVDSLDAARTARAIAEGELATACAAIEAATAAFQRARDRLGQAQARCDTLAGQLAEQEELATERSRAWADALRQAGLDADRFAAAATDSEDLDGLDRQLAAHDDEQLRTAADRLRLDAAVAGRAAPDLDQLRADDAAATAALALAREQLFAAASRIDTLDRLAAQLHTALGRQAEAEADHGTVGGLAELASGRNAQNLRLHDFAILATFEAVLDAANRRFARMSRGRYTLIRKVEGHDNRSRAGLGIAVFDAFTDQARDAHTLSGGEGFLAALSLALGLSDVVQAQAGGVRLEAIFIDEGFGHLDDESLDIALETLRDLVGTARAVGVISHVEAVKLQIPAGFDVVQTPAGSHVTPRHG